MWWFEDPDSFRSDKGYESNDELFGFSTPKGTGAVPDFFVPGVTAVGLWLPVSGGR